VRLNAAQWLVRGGGKASRKRQTLEADRTTDRPEETVEELRALYRKALPEQEPPLVEAVSDGAADGQAGEAAAEHLSQVAEPLVEVAAKAEPARAEEEAPEPGEPATVEVSIVVASQPALSVPAGAHSLLFPAKCRRVPIQP